VFRTWGKADILTSHENYSDDFPLEKIDVYKIKNFFFLYLSLFFNLFIMLHYSTLAVEIEYFLDYKIAKNSAYNF